MEAENPKRRSWPPPDADMLFNGDRATSETSTSSSAMMGGASCSAKASAAAVAACLSVLLVVSHVTVFYAGLRDKETDCGVAILEPPKNAASGNWTVILRRGQFGLPADYFRRNFISYVEGFGEPRAEFWLGLERIRALTHSGAQFNRFLLFGIFLGAI